VWVWWCVVCGREERGMALGWRREERKAPPPAVSPLHPHNKHPTLLPPRNTRNPRPQDTPQAETQSRSKDMMLWGLSNPDDDGFSAVIRSKVCGMPNPERAPFAGRVRKQREIPAADHSKSSAQSNKSPPSVAKGEEEERRLWSIEAEQRPPGPAPKPAGSELAEHRILVSSRCVVAAKERAERRPETHNRKNESSLVLSEPSPAPDAVCRPAELVRLQSCGAFHEAGRPRASCPLDKQRPSSPCPPVVAQGE